MTKLHYFQLHSYSDLVHFFLLLKLKQSLKRQVTKKEIFKTMQLLGKREGKAGESVGYFV